MISFKFFPQQNTLNRNESQTYHSTKNHSKPILNIKKNHFSHENPHYHTTKNSITSKNFHTQHPIITIQRKQRPTPVESPDFINTAQKPQSPPPRTHTHTTIAHNSHKDSIIDTGSEEFTYPRTRAESKYPARSRIPGHPGTRRAYIYQGRLAIKWRK